MKYRKKSMKLSLFLHLRRNLLPLLAIALLALSVLISCTGTKAIAEDNTFNEVLAGMFPSLPELPALPALEWEYRDGRYSIGEDDVDKLLDYGENQIPLYRYKLQVYSQSIDAIKEALIKDKTSLANSSL